MALNASRPGQRTIAVWSAFIKARGAFAAIAHSLANTGTIAILETGGPGLGAITRRVAVVVIARCFTGVVHLFSNTATVLSW